MSEFRAVPVSEFLSLFDRLNKEWMLITATDGETVNAMTASWGAFGILWNKPVAICFIRPQRYTFPLTEKASTLSLSFFSSEYRAALTYMGRNSGRDGDKFAATNLHVVTATDGTPYPAQAQTVLLCRKLYAGRLDPAAFCDAGLIPANYPGEDFHQMYICEISQVLSREREKG